MNDRKTTLADLRGAMADFVARRDWQKFHQPRNLSMSIAIEAAELMEHFQWDAPGTDEQPDAERKEEIAAEMADILLYLCSLANRLDIDLSAAAERKLERNRRRFPADRVFGRAVGPLEESS
ncbi:MAG: nucleotide pyrophosphohydrolase [Geothermobacteraceae bacterium]|nr:MAG: nucleotide pyrophosphohydrolase [Deltaproteobacteria bacterium]